MRQALAAAEEARRNSDDLGCMCASVGRDPYAYGSGDCRKAPLIIRYVSSRFSGGCKTPDASSVRQFLFARPGSSSQILSSNNETPTIGTPLKAVKQAVFWSVNQTVMGV